MPVLSELKAIFEPSGEKWGNFSIAGVLVIRRAFPPFFEATHISPPYSNATSFALIDGCVNSLVPWPVTIHGKSKDARIDPAEKNFIMKFITLIIYDTEELIQDFNIP
jgi:hypothetical protein